MPDTVQQWQEYVDEYESNMEDVREHTQSILNDPSSSAADKQKAVEDLTASEIHLQELKAANSQIQTTGIVPSSITFGKNNCGCFVFKWNDDGKIHSAMYNPVSGSGNVRDVNNGVSLGTFFISDIITVSAKTSYRYPGDPPYNVTFSEYANTSGTYKDFGIHTDSVIPSAGDVKIKFTSSVLTIADYQFSTSLNTTLIRAQVGDLSNPVTWTSGGTTVIPLNLTYVGLVNTPTETVDGDKPWDYFNNYIKPNIDPSNSPFPDGYRPEEPDDPPDEPTDIPHDDGEPPDHQRDREVGLPSQFITQYILSYRQLQTFGLNLWQSWLTPNTDVWKNFFLPYASDFGTLNIGACLDFIVSLRVYPVDFADYLDLLGGSNGLYMGTGHTDFLGTSCAITRKLFHAFDCGTCEVKPEKPYNDYRDMYNTSVSVVLPYCGTVELTPAEVMYRNLRAYYYVDFQSGACTAVVEVEGDSGWYMVASKTGQMGFLLPITATNAGQLSAQFGKDATETLGTLAGWFFDTAKTIGNGLFGMAGSYLDNKSSKEEKLMGIGKTGFDMLVDSGQTNVSTGIELVNQSLNRLSRSGIDMPMLSGGGGTEALMFPDTPYVQIRRGKYAKPDNYPHSQGFLNGSSNTIEYYKGAFQGTPTIDTSYQGRGLCKFTGVDSTGLTCNNDERVEIVNLLESGIYI